MILIGKCIALLCLAPLQNQLGNDVPILECQTSGIVLIPPRRFLLVRIDEALPQMAINAFFDQ